MRMRTLLTVLVLTVAAGCVHSSGSRGREFVLGRTAKQVLLPGTYAIEFRASGGGFLKPVVAVGALSLLSLDRKVRDDGYLHYGWTNAGLGTVNAPICGGEASPTSRDPLNPGVLARSDNGRYVLTIASESHKYRPGWTRFDGCGIVLRCQLANASVRPVTPLAVASIAPIRLARHAVR